MLILLKCVFVRDLSSYMCTGVRKKQFSPCGFRAFSIKNTFLFNLWQGFPMMCLCVYDMHAFMCVCVSMYTCTQMQTCMYILWRPMYFSALKFEDVAVICQQCSDTFKKIRLLSGFSEHACKGTVIMENHFNHFNVLVLYPVLLLNMERQQLNSNTVLLLWGTCLCSFISFLNLRL